MKSKLILIAALAAALAGAPALAAHHAAKDATGSGMSQPDESSQKHKHKKHAHKKHHGKKKSQTDSTTTQQ